MEMEFNPPPNSGQWTTGICGCFEDIGSCCMGCWCPCISVGRYIEVIDQGYTQCVTGGLIYGLIQIISGCGCVYSFVYRERLRRKYGLPEAPCADILTEFCCHGCSICQMTRELKNRNVDPALGYEAVKHIYDQPYRGTPPTQQNMMK